MVLKRRLKRDRLKADGSREVPVFCPLCNGKAEANNVKRVWRCFQCPASGVAGPSDLDGDHLSSTLSTRPERRLATSPTPVPIIGRNAIALRGLDPAIVIRRYGLRWIDERLGWPLGTARSYDGGSNESNAGKTSQDGSQKQRPEPSGGSTLLGSQDANSHRPDGSPLALGPGAGAVSRLQGQGNARRAGLRGPQPALEGRSWSLRSWTTAERPKTLVRGSRGLLGAVRLGKAQHLVITEGDYKAACIPLPWIGVGLCGLAISKEQRDTILEAEPSSVVIMLDGGCEREARAVARALLPLQARITAPPHGRGPDDIPRQELYGLLLNTKGE